METWRFRAGDVLLLNSNSPKTFLNKTIFDILKFFHKETRKLNLKRVWDYGIVIELKNATMVAMFDKKVVYLEAIENLDNRIVSVMVPKNDYNKAERTSITDLVMTMIGNRKGDKFILKEGYVKYISEAPGIINSVRPFTLEDGTFPVAPLIETSEFYVNIESKPRRKVKQK